MSKDRTYLVTGAMGCLGSWVLHHLTEAGKQVVATDLGTDPVRPRLVMGEAELAKVTWAQLDVTDTKAVNAAVADHGVTHIIHLAGLQIPFCKANPPLGAAVNVTGTVNILEAARHNAVRGVAYASSLAAFGPTEMYDTWPLPDDATPVPLSLYGVYKVANEETARIYAQDWDVGSIGLRPYVVYGVGRDQGMTADMAKAILAVAAGQPFHIRFSGEVALQHASDAARIFIACAETESKAAEVCNLRNDVIEVAAFVDLLKSMYPEAEITFEEGNPLPFPADLSDAGLRRLIGDVPHTEIKARISADVDAYRALIQSGGIDLGQLEN